MRQKLMLLFATAFTSLGLFAASVGSYTQTIAMIPMRDGVKLYTVIYTPADGNGPFPFLIERTPYGAERPRNYFPYSRDMGKQGYIFVYQDIRGKYNSEGSMEIHEPIVHLQSPGKTDESTDTWDTIDWLLKNVPNNNGKAGITGVSYPGWLALVGAIDPHPALKASSPQAEMSDLFLGDDFHHNGAFRLSYGMEYAYMVEGAKTEANFNFPARDLYDWYMQLGSLKNVNARYFHDSIPSWNHFVQHPDYDSFWQKNSPLSYMKAPEIPMLHVGGYYDQEDIMGPQLMYSHLEKTDSHNRNYICLGPWFHGQWARGKGDSIGRITLGMPTSEWFADLQQKWFAWWLKGEGDGEFAEANTFQTGSNTWKSYNKWPPASTISQKLYLQPNGTCSFSVPSDKSGKVSFDSDPAKPVPYRPLPIQATYAPDSKWRTWHVDDQRFAYTRPDVLSFTGDILKTPLTVTGSIVANLVASTTGSDADWIVKLIDVYPAIDTERPAMSGYQLPVAMEVFRGRYRKSFSKPVAMTAGKPESIQIDLHQINHVFKPGHRLMVQIQSSWFPVIDRNPQTFVPNIFMANENDYKKATHIIFCNALQPSYITLPVDEQ